MKTLMISFAIMATGAYSTLDRIELDILSCIDDKEELFFLGKPSSDVLRMEDDRLYTLRMSHRENILGICNLDAVKVICYNTEVVGKDAKFIKLFNTFDKCNIIYKR